MQRLCVIFVAIVMCNIAFARSMVQNVLPNTAVVAGAVTAYSEGQIAWGNPASAANDTTYSLKLGYENRYFSSELSDEYLLAMIPTPYFNIGLSYNFFGLAAYHEMMAAISVSRKWGRVALGVEADYFNYYDASQVRYHYAFTAQLGIQVDVTKHLVLGFRAFNPIFSEIRLYDVPRQLPVIFDVGASYHFVSNVDLLAQVGYEVGRGVMWAVGVEYDIQRVVIAKIGVRGSDYVIPMVGVGVRFGQFRFDLSAEADFRVGVSLMSSLSCFFNKSR